MKKHKLGIIISLILLFVPFFWLKPGEMNLGGDSGRLYFYDPANYLNIHAFYNYLESGFGVELTNYIYLPYTSLLLLLKCVFKSSTILISLFNGLILSVGFLSVYLILKELLDEKVNLIKSKCIELSSILGGLFYILSQISIFSGWERPITTFNQVFLNPLMALLILKFLLTQRMKYVILVIFVSFIFTPNFSIEGAPTFFAFYPITIVFLILYVKFVKRIRIKWKLLSMGLILFLFAHAFHLFSTVQSIFSPGSSYNQTIFAKVGEIGSRNALDYFISIHATIKSSLIWMGLAQFQNKPYLVVFIIFPVILVISFLLNRGRTLLLTGLIFLISFYLTSSITDAGFFIYKQFFRIPGFTMFRNFHAQWTYVFYFFYSILLGQAIAIVLNKTSKKIALVCFSVLGVIIVGFGLPFLSGSVSMHTDQDTGVSQKFLMDPSFEKVLEYFRTNNTNGKVLMFPLTSPGYQILQGKNGGAYMGLPIISYLGGKSEFSGYQTLGIYKDIFTSSMKNNDYKTLEKLFSIMNIKWIFFNSDPYVYSKAFAPQYNYPSGFTSQYQSKYETLLDKLSISKIIDFSNRYLIFSVKDDVYFPLIYVTNSVIFTNNDIGLILNSNFEKDIHQAVIPAQNGVKKDSSIILYGLEKSFVSDVTDDSHFHKHVPFIGKKNSDLLYPLALIKEKFDLIRARKNPNSYIDYSLFLLSKRIEELRIYGVDMDIGKENWREPYIWQINKWFSYDTWNASFLRYEKAVNDVMEWIDKSEISDEGKLLYKLKVNEQLYQHELTLLRTVYYLNKQNSEKTYLVSSINSMYENLYDKVNFPMIDTSLFTYKLPYYANSAGEYEVYLQSKNPINKDWSQKTFIQLNSQTLKSVSQNENNTLLRFQNITLANKNDSEVTVNIPATTLVKEAKWDNSGNYVNDDNGDMTMFFDNKTGDLMQGLNFKIPDWTPNGKYIISFDYNTSGDNFILSIVEKEPLSDSVRKVTQKILFEKRLNSTDFIKHQSIIVAEQNTSDGFLKIVPFSPNDMSVIRIKKLTVQKVDYPQLIFQKLISTKSDQKSPRIVFAKINPTKYKLNISGVTDSYTLVFLESFNNNWRLFDSENNMESFEGELARFIGKIGKIFVNFLVKDEKINKMTAVTSYFNNKVGEAKSNNTFINSETFNTWGKNAIADNTHTLVDGYANSWYIKPEDVGGKTDYTLILELKTQKPFYVTIALSLLTVVGLLLYLVIRLIWSKKQ